LSVNVKTFGGSANEISALVRLATAEFPPRPCDRDLETFAFERHDECVGRSHVAARIGNKQFELFA
jgi:hypothetical protein